ncbi:MAG: hypothetical protein Kow0062_06860 [Acidobacteriota bacterium]|nr:MAG: hypothetical protein D6738_00595 [Acidobacteriota bacterium]
MTRDEIRALMSALLDGEIDAGRAAELRRAIEADPELRREFEQLLALRGAARQALVPPPVDDADWEALALRVAAGTSAGVGWTLLAPGAAALVLGGLAGFLLSDEVPLWIRLACGATIAGLAFLLLSAIADRLRARRIERYDGVER